jgi:hypothetical protein
MRSHRSALGPLDLLELVDGGRLAVVPATDALGEQILDVGFSHKKYVRGGVR